jgi:anti-sigma B factor antagonist
LDPKTITVEVDDSDDRRLIRVAGELELVTVGQLGTLLSSCEREELGRIVLDLEAVEFIDSSGLALLLCAHRRLNAGGTYRLRVVPSRALAVRRVMAVTGVDKLLPSAERAPA